MIPNLTMKALCGWKSARKSAYEAPYAERGPTNSLGCLECALSFLTQSLPHWVCDRPTCKDPDAVR